MLSKIALALVSFVGVDHHGVMAVEPDFCPSPGTSIHILTRYSAEIKKCN